MTRLNAFRRRRGLTLAALGEALGVSTASAGRYVLPGGHRNHKRPNRDAAARLREWSGGLVDSANYADPYLPEMDAAWRAAGLLPAEPAPETEAAS